MTASAFTDPNYACDLFVLILGKIKKNQKPQETHFKNSSLSCKHARTLTFALTLPPPTDTPAGPFMPTWSSAHLPATWEQLPAADSSIRHLHSPATQESVRPAHTAPAQRSFLPGRMGCHGHHRRAPSPPETTMCLDVAMTIWRALSRDQAEVCVMGMISFHPRMAWEVHTILHPHFPDEDRNA